MVWRSIRSREAFYPALTRLLPNANPLLSRGGVARSAGVVLVKKLIFLTNTTPVEAFIDASPYRARPSRPRLSPPRLRRGVCRPDVGRHLLTRRAKFYRRSAAQI